jgi:transcriptional regulator with XRE-family HTH domain
MQAKTWLGPGFPRSCPYTPGVPKRPKERSPRPSHGARLLALRKAAGLSQTQLAELVGETQGNISFWERTDKPPRSDILSKLARVLGVSVETLLGVSNDLPEAPPLASGPGRTGELQRAFEEARKLPRRQQQKVVEFVIAFVNEQKRRAS